ncbi:hypothetical protein ET495_16045 [Xylanimonas allomyrinae]|uniref:Uncharacterized protein n=1 Tax=Xylanimonas allomyrinae TaxID=2509459 RepID=A0A4P6EP12_9MICO|nr:hypothetical protein [Xylanimonas allomyrinae]QAY64474.1 hypothetical protein ET495_16045 [Xylanimonas allomyrinae]
MTKTTDGYLQTLVLALHARRVPSHRIGEVVAEVDSHVAETGEDPREAFGDAHDYARVVEPHPPRRGPRLALEALLGGLTVSPSSLLSPEPCAASTSWGCRSRSPPRWPSRCARRRSGARSGCARPCTTRAPASA